MAPSRTLVQGILHLIGSTRMNPDAMKNPIRSNSMGALKRSLKKYFLDEAFIGKHKIATFNSSHPSTNLHIIYLHGGAYIWQGGSLHWNFIRKILQSINCRVTYIDYPLAPEYTQIDTFEMLNSGYDYLNQKYTGDRFVFIGDSSGGGLALAFAQYLKKSNHSNQPKKLILLSPWLDLNLDNPEIKEVEKSDPILSVKGLKYAGDLYSGKTNKSSYLVSPIFGDLNGLEEINIFIGTHDILWPDCKKIINKAKEIGIEIKLFEYVNKMHVWMLFPSPGKNPVLEEIKRILENV